MHVEVIRSLHHKMVASKSIGRKGSSGFQGRIHETIAEVCHRTKQESSTRNTLHYCDPWNVLASLTKCVVSSSSWILEKVWTPPKLTGWYRSSSDSFIFFLMVDSGTPCSRLADRIEEPFEISVMASRNWCSVQLPFSVLRWYFLGIWNTTFWLQNINTLTNSTYIQCRVNVRAPSYPIKSAHSYPIMRFLHFFILQNPISKKFNKTTHQSILD